MLIRVLDLFAYYYMYKISQQLRAAILFVSITKTYLNNFDPLKPHLYIVKLGFTGVYIIFLISAQNIDCGYSLERLSEAVLTSIHNLCFEQKYEKYLNFYLKTFSF